MGSLKNDSVKTCHVNTKQNFVKTGSTNLSAYMDLDASSVIHSNSTKTLKVN